MEIGDSSFRWCNHSIMNINIPNSLRRIKYCAFSHSHRTPIRLHDSIERIGYSAFAGCIFTNFRVPPLITVISDGISGCKYILSIELPENVTDIGDFAFIYCYCLRNVALPPRAVFGDFIFIGIGTQGSGTMTDLQRMFGLKAEIISELQHRFVGLPIHSLIYYQTYNQLLILRKNSLN